MTNEPFVPAEVAATHLGVNRRFLLSLARQGIKGAYPLGTGQRMRNRWVFRLSELTSSIDPNAMIPPMTPPKPGSPMAPQSVGLHYPDRRRSSLK